MAIVSGNLERLKHEIHKVIVGYEDVVEKILISLLSGGHVLLVGVPGLAKTLMVKTVSRALDLKFNRIQFTPDLMPSDIVGTEIIQDVDGKKVFQFVRGPIFANVILADEINRTPPKTQAALLEAMQEKRVSVMGKTYELDEPFFVLATQNPIEQEGTYPLPEAQLDRFMMQINLNYPDFEQEVEIVERTTSGEMPDVEPVLSREDVLQLQKRVREMIVGEHVIRYAVELVRQTRPESSSVDIVKEFVQWGAGPRASQSLIMGAKAKAFLDGRDYATTRDVAFVFPDVVRHRVILNFVAEAEGVRVDDVIDRVLSAVPRKT